MHNPLINHVGVVMCLRGCGHECGLGSYQLSPRFPPLLFPCGLAPHPTISSLTANNRKIIAKSGTQLRLECTARGRTRALQFSWTLNGSTSRLPSSSGPQYSSGTHSRSTLTIPSPRAQYSGNYACIANNTGTGETDSQMIAIIVIGK